MRVVIIKATSCSNYNYRVSVDSKLPSYKILFRLRDAVDKVLREGKCGLKKVEDISTKFSLLG